VALYQIQHFDRRDDGAVAYLRKHAGYGNFEAFYGAVDAAVEAWLTNHPNVALPLLLGRHMRLGPEPPWIAFWRVDSVSPRSFEEGPLNELPNVTVFTDTLWEPIFDGLAEEPPSRRGGRLYYVEWLSPRDQFAPAAEIEDQLTENFVGWSVRNPEDRPLLVMRGTSEQGAYCTVRGFPALARLDTLAGQSESAANSSLYRRMKLVNAGIYADFSAEQL
jgi:hypothetical protein